VLKLDFRAVKFCVLPSTGFIYIRTLRGIIIVLQTQLTVCT